MPQSHRPRNTSSGRSKNIRCPVHDQTAREVSATESREGRETFSVACCCEALRAEIEKAFTDESYDQNRIVGLHPARPRASSTSMPFVPCQRIQSVGGSAM